MPGARHPDQPESPRVLLIMGPTAGGKSQLAMAAAEAASVASGARSGAQGGAEIISADAFAVYRGMDIGTAKPSVSERACVPHHLIDIVEPTEAFTVHEWLVRAEAAIAQVRSRGRIPIVVGGTLLYARALLEGLFEAAPPDPQRRAELRALPLPELRARLERADPESAARIHPNDARRTVRALEVLEQTGTPISMLQRQWTIEGTRRADLVAVALHWPALELNRRINDRVGRMLDAGLVEEARQLWSAGRLGPTAREALGYKQLVAHFEGRCTLDDAVERIKIETRRFGKQQRTWLRRLGVFPGVALVSGPDIDPADLAQSLVKACITKDHVGPEPKAPGGTVDTSSRAWLVDRPSPSA